MAKFCLKTSMSYDVWSSHTGLKYNFRKGVPLEVKHPHDIYMFRQMKDRLVEVDESGKEVSLIKGDKKQEQPKSFDRMDFLPAEQRQKVYDREKRQREKKKQEEQEKRKKEIEEKAEKEEIKKKKELDMDKSLDLEEKKLMEEKLEEKDFEEKEEVLEEEDLEEKDLKEKEELEEEEEEEEKELEYPEDLEVTDSALELMKENGLDYNEIVGTGKDGRILKGDVQDYLDRME